MTRQQIIAKAQQACINGQTQKDNPFNMETEPTQHETWARAFGDEDAYWEYQGSINVHHR